MRTTTGQERADHIVSLDLLRGFAALSVLVFHLFKDEPFKSVPWLHAVISQGHLGLDLFFLLSGFIIPYSLHQNHYSTASFPRYLLRRSCRIEIPYVASFLLVIIMRMVHSAGSGELYLPPAKQFLLHFLYLNQYFGEEAFIPVYWTLAIEFQFYILIGLLYGPILSRSRWVPILIFIGWTVLSRYVWAPYNWFIIDYGLIFLAGTLLFLFKIGRLTVWTFPLFLSITLFLLHGKSGIGPTLTVVSGLATILLLKRHWWLTDFFGRISYSLYLTHLEAAGWLGVYARDVVRNELLLKCIMVVFAIAFAIAFHHLIERPALRLSKRIAYTRPTRDRVP